MSVSELAQDSMVIVGKLPDPTVGLGASASPVMGLHNLDYPCLDAFVQMWQGISGSVSTGVNAQAFGGSDTDVAWSSRYVRGHSVRWTAGEFTWELLEAEQDSAGRLLSLEPWTSGVFDSTTRYDITQSSGVGQTGVTVYFRESGCTAESRFELDLEESAFLANVRASDLTRLDRSKQKVNATLYDDVLGSSAWTIPLQAVVKGGSANETIRFKVQTPGGDPLEQGQGNEEQAEVFAEASIGLGTSKGSPVSLRLAESGYSPTWGTAEECRSDLLGDYPQWEYFGCQAADSGVWQFYTASFSLGGGKDVVVEADIFIVAEDETNDVWNRARALLSGIAVGP
ncbi:MAG: hypothetical protein LBR33_08175 [Propionibacteriaceae bacterium]|jgi:hypothetical protein|nr:hypothetical protein [Propionibacteriaceae bacterium]